LSVYIVLLYLRYTQRAMAKINFDIREEDRAAFQKKCFKEDVSMAHVLRTLVKNYSKEKK
jgi:hypothetical protein